MLCAAVLAGCGGASAPARSPATASAATAAAPTATATTAKTTVHRVGSRRPFDRYPALSSHWQVISTIAGRPALWIEQRSGVTFVRINQRLAHLALHAGSVDPGGTGWRYGDVVAGHELSHLIFGFNGGFKFPTGSGGFFSYDRTGSPLLIGRGSVVTYRDGTTDIGAWRQGVPARRHPFVSVRQNLDLLIAGGRANASVATCGSSCWGATIGGSSVARSGLGVQRNGRLIWAAGASLTVGQLAAGMLSVGVVRGVQMDINPAWVAGYLYVHHRQGPLTPVPAVPGQFGIAGHLLAPYSRDFFTVLST